MCQKKKTPTLFALGFFLCALAKSFLLQDPPAKLKTLAANHAMKHFFSYENSCYPQKCLM